MSATILIIAVCSLPRSLDLQTDAPGKLTFEERLGPDDGAALAILFGANMRGNLDLCDCNHPRGGLARRVGYIEGFRKKFKETPIIVVEAGFFLFDSTGYPPKAVLQNDQVVRAYSRWPVDVINLARYDLIYAQRLLVQDGLVERERELPMIKNLISANGVFGAEVKAPPAYLIKKVTGPRIKGAKTSLRIAFVGLAGPIKPAEGIDVTVKDVFKTARPIVQLARKDSDVLVIVAHVGVDDAVRLAIENPEADVVIAGNAEGAFKPRQVSKTLVVCAAPGNTQQGDLRIYLSGEGGISFKFTSSDLDELVPADPAAAAYAEAARIEREQFR
jgi:2',3'-cyclic-nucleotide 2'-phosphodiesterase (5'-nucleotidase family)